MLVSTTHRTSHPEIMDDLDLKGEELRLTLLKIGKINRFLGGNRLTRKGVQQLLRKEYLFDSVSILDVGCGNGDMLRKLADFGIRNKLNLELIGVDANAFIVSNAQNLSVDYPNIRFYCLNVFDESFKELKCDISLCTLTLHHFKNDEIVELLGVFKQNSRLGFVVNDLHRNKVAYYLFKLICFVFRFNEMSRKDGLVSILRGFKKEELVAFSEKLNLKNYSIRWKWAFRYQWIVEK